MNQELFNKKQKDAIVAFTKSIIKLSDDHKFDRGKVYQETIEILRLTSACASIKNLEL